MKHSESSRGLSCIHDSTGLTHYPMS